MRKMLRIALMPVMFSVRLLLGLLAFVTTVATQIVGWTFSLFLIMGIFFYCTNNMLNGHIAMGIALLVSPLGLPLISEMLFKFLDRMLGFFEGIFC